MIISEFHFSLVQIPSIGYNPISCCTSKNWIQLLEFGFDWLAQLLACYFCTNQPAVGLCIPLHVVMWWYILFSPDSIASPHFIPTLLAPFCHKIWTQAQRWKKSKVFLATWGLGLKLSAKTKESDMKKIAFCPQIDFRATKMSTN